MTAKNFHGNDSGYLTKTKVFKVDNKYQSLDSVIIT